ncbi:MAG: YdeI/OmpD-associated family protein [Acidimicrobiales bacterium]
MKFTAVLESHGKTATGIEIPASVIDKLGGGKRALIRVTIKGHTYASAIGSMNGRSLISVSADNRTKAGINAGDRVTVDVVLDTEKRDIEIPADFAKVLAKNATAKRAFDALSNSNKKRHVLSIEGAKTDETRQRRIAKALAELS